MHGVVEKLKKPETLVEEFSPFDDAEFLGYENAIIIPQAVDGVPVTSEFVTELKTKIADLYNSYTIHQATGGWVDPEGKLVEETVSYYTVAFDPNNEEAVNNMYTLAVWVKTTLKQEAVYVKVGHETFLV